MSVKAGRPRARRIPRTSPNFVDDKFLLVDVIVDIDGRASEHVVTVLQQQAHVYTVTA